MLKASYLLAALFLLSSATVKAQITGQTHLLGWWYLIHCDGAEGHSEELPPSETYTSEGEGVQQCHGVPGEFGTCEASDLGASWEVSCATQPNTGVQRCYAAATCPGEPSMNCGGPGQQAFAGTYSMHSTIYAFIKCTSEDGNTVLSLDDCAIN